MSKRSHSRMWRIMVVTFATLALVELSSVLVYRLAFHEPFSRRIIQSKLAIGDPPPSPHDEHPTPAAVNVLSSHILHPYLGFVANPGRYVADWEFSRNGQATTINEFGFPGMSPVVKRQPDSVTICILGGSFAMNFFLDSRDVLVAALQQRPAFKGKIVNVVSLAMSGWKQPQQLLALTYLLSLGAQYDFVINLDGFNEVALPSSENIPAGVYPFFPRSWNVYASRIESEDAILDSATLIRLRNRARYQRQVFSSPILRYSNFFLLIFEILDRGVQRQMGDTTGLLQAAAKQSAQRSYQSAGPKPPEPVVDKVLFSDLTAKWEAASRLMNDLCQRNGALYIHFLQPNQYVPGSKKMGKAERSIAYHEGSDSSYKNAVLRGYSELTERGRSLAKDGIHFVDLTMFFESVVEVVWGDTCCHVIKYGNDLIAQKIASEIILASSPPQASTQSVR